MFDRESNKSHVIRVIEVIYMCANLRNIIYINTYNIINYIKIDTVIMYNDICLFQLYLYFRLRFELHAIIRSRKVYILVELLFLFILRDYLLSFIQLIIFVISSDCSSSRQDMSESLRK